MIEKYIEKQLEAKEIEWQKQFEYLTMNVNQANRIQDPLYERNLISELMVMAQLKTEICKLRELKEFSFIQRQLSEEEP